MSTAASYISLPQRFLSEDETETNPLCIPPEAHTWAGFHRWLESGRLPEKMKTHFIDGSVYLDMSEEAIQSHVLVKAAIFATLMSLIRTKGLGEFFPDGILVRNKKAGVSNNPDGVAVFWATTESGRVRFVERKGREMILQGTPDWVMEIVSDNSVTKDTKKLRLAYHKAKIPEYWLIDARGAEINFQILGWRKAGYAQLAVEDGWHRSRIFTHEFRLVRSRNRRGAWDYMLEVRETP